MARKIAKQSTRIAHFVREGKECCHAQKSYAPGEEFTPFDSLTVTQQNIHLPNLERREVSAELTPEEAIAVIDQETDDPTNLADALV